MFEATTALIHAWPVHRTPQYSGHPPLFPGYDSQEDAPEATAVPGHQSEYKQSPRYSGRPRPPPRHNPREDAPSATRSVPKESYVDEALAIVIGTHYVRRPRQATGLTDQSPNRRLRLRDEIEGSSDPVVIYLGDPFYEHVDAIISFELCLMRFPSSVTYLAEMGSMALSKRNKKPRDNMVFDFLDPLDDNSSQFN